MGSKIAFLAKVFHLFCFLHKLLSCKTDSNGICPYCLVYKRTTTETRTLLVLKYFPLTADSAFICKMSKNVPNRNLLKFTSDHIVSLSHLFAFLQGGFQRRTVSWLGAVSSWRFVVTEGLLSLSETIALSLKDRY